MAAFTIRVYGLFLNDQHELLLSDERIDKFTFTKFPGGGLEFGEGLIDCLKREWREELSIEIEVLEHFYTTDFFQASAFHSSTQIISVYYMVRAIEPQNIDLSQPPHVYDYGKKEEAFFRWVPLSSLQTTDLTFPIDRHVLALLKSRFA